MPANFEKTVVVITSRFGDFAAATDDFSKNDLIRLGLN